MAFFMRVLSILILVTTLAFVSLIFSGQTTTAFTQWRELLPRWIIGLAVLNYFMTGFSSLANAVRAEQSQGTLESVLMTPINLPTLIASSSAWPLAQATLLSALYPFFGWLFFGVTFQGNFLLALLLLILTTLVLASIGILSASFAIVFKRGDPFGILLGTGAALFSGVFFPVELLGNFNYISRALPTTYGISGISGVLLEGHGLSEIRQPLITLCLFLAVLLPFSLWVFSRAVARAKREGSLIQY